MDMETGLVDHPSLSEFGSQLENVTRKPHIAISCPFFIASYRVWNSTTLRTWGMHRVCITSSRSRQRQVLSLTGVLPINLAFVAAKCNLARVAIMHHRACGRDIHQKCHLPARNKFIQEDNINFLCFNHRSVTARLSNTNGLTY